MPRPKSVGQMIKELKQIKGGKQYYGCVFIGVEKDNTATLHRFIPRYPENKYRYDRELDKDYHYRYLFSVSHLDYVEQVLKISLMQKSDYIRGIYKNIKDIRVGLDRISPDVLESLYITRVEYRDFYTGTGYTQFTSPPRIRIPNKKG